MKKKIFLKQKNTSVMKFGFKKANSFCFLGLALYVLNGRRIIEINEQNRVNWGVFETPIKV